MARTAKQRAALRKAQIASARKRRGKGKGKLAAAHRRSRRNAQIATGAGIALVGLAAGITAHRYAKNNLYTSKHHQSGSTPGLRYRKSNYGARSVSLSVGSRKGIRANTFTVHHDPDFARSRNRKKVKHSNLLYRESLHGHMKTVPIPTRRGKKNQVRFL